MKKSIIPYLNLIGYLLIANWLDRMIPVYLEYFEIHMMEAPLWGKWVGQIIFGFVTTAFFWYMMTSRNFSHLVYVLFILIGILGIFTSNPYLWVPDEIGLFNFILFRLGLGYGVFGLQLQALSFITGIGLLGLIKKKKE